MALVTAFIAGAAVGVPIGIVIGSLGALFLVIRAIRVWQLFLTFFAWETACG